MHNMRDAPRSESAPLLYVLGSATLDSRRRPRTQTRPLLEFARISAQSKTSSLAAKASRAPSFRGSLIVFVPYVLFNARNVISGVVSITESGFKIGVSRKAASETISSLGR